MEDSLGCGRTMWRLRGTAAAVVPADGYTGVILRSDDAHLIGPSTACILTSPDVGETIDVRSDPGPAARVLRFNPAEVCDLAALPRDVVGAIHATKVVRILHTFRSFGAAPEVDLLTSPAGGWVKLIRRAVAAGAGAVQMAGKIGWPARRLRRRMFATFGYGYGALVQVARMRRALSLMGPKRGSPTDPIATHWLS